MNDLVRKKPLLFFCAFPIYPPHSGLDRRCLELLKAFKNVGLNVTLCSLYNPKHGNPWGQESIIHLQTFYVAQVRLYALTKADRLYLKLWHLWHVLKRGSGDFSSRSIAAPGLIRWFSRLAVSLDAGAALVVYANWASLLADLPPQVLKVIEMIDLVSLNARMWTVADRENSGNFSALLDENLFLRLKLEADPEEINAYDIADYTLAISRTEAEAVSRMTSKTKVITLPMTLEPATHVNTYRGNAIFLMGPNPFNLQGARLFIGRILPAILLEVPEFEVSFTGFNDGLQTDSAVKLCGFVPDLEDLFIQARFLICPVYGGTGQLVKVLEAMSHGIPAIVFRHSSHRAPIEHGIDGLIAEDSAHFARLAIRLWSNPEECRAMGAKARLKVAHQYSTRNLMEGLQPLLCDSRWRLDASPEGPASNR
jgi:glycosyltransferase involved in cell wall biosynthesis